MSVDFAKEIIDICSSFENDSSRMMDIVISVQEKYGCVSDESIDLIAREVSVPRVKVESVVSFYAFLSKKPKGKVVIRVCNDIIDLMNGGDHVAKEFSKNLGINFGETTPDGKISLEYTPCIGMSDQAPAALVNDVVVTNLGTDKVHNIVDSLKKYGDPKKLVKRFGDGNNANELVKSMVNNNIRIKGEVIFAFGEYKPNTGLEKALALSPVEVINEIKNARLRGRGGAGFPTGMKWEFTRAAEGDNKYIICNADEGEPGTFKDRVIITECSDLLFEGMTIAGYAIGAETGILYLRGEYAYLNAFLEKNLEERRKNGLLGKNILSKEGFNFDIRIQMGAGAYICGEETALISSCEGERGDPKNRPPFPAQKGYMKNPTCVNNVETLCSAVRIMDNGAAWFDKMGTVGSAGTKVLSISGDCQSPGVYEYPFGITISELLKEVGAENAQAVQIGGPSGQLIGPEEFGRSICFDDLGTGGSIMIFGPDRSILEIVRNFMEFFIDESCGFCTPCRVGNVLLKKCIEKIIEGKGTPSDLEYLKEIGEMVKTASRCGLGQTSANPILSSLKNFNSEYTSRIKEDKDGLRKSFDIHAVLQEAEKITGRKSVHFSQVKEVK